MPRQVGLLSPRRRASSERPKRSCGMVGQEIQDRRPRVRWVGTRGLWCRTARRADSARRSNLEPSSGRYIDFSLERVLVSRHVLTATGRRHRRGRATGRRRTHSSSPKPICSRVCSTWPGASRRARMWPSTTTATTRSCTAAPGPSPRWAWTTPTPCTSAPACSPATSTSSPAGAAPPPTVSFQLLGGEYTDDDVPDSETAFDDRKLDIAADGTFEWRFTPDEPAQLVIREVYNDWSAQRGTFAIARTDTAGTAPPPLTKELDRKALRRRGQATRAAGEDVAAVPAVVLRQPAGEHADRAAADPRRAGHPVLVGRAFRPDARAGDRHHVPVTDAPYLGFQLGSLWYISLDYINHQTSLNGTQAQADPDGKIRYRGVRRQPRRGELGARRSGTARAICSSAGSGCRVSSPRPTDRRVELRRRRRRRRRRCRTTSRTRSPKRTWRERIALRQKQIGGQDGGRRWLRTAGGQGRGDQRCRSRAGHDAGAAMRARRAPIWCSPPAPSNGSRRSPSRSPQRAAAR